MPESLSDATLLDVADGLRVMYKSLSSTAKPLEVKEMWDAWDVVTKEMRARGLLYEPLVVRKDDPTSSDVHVDAIMGSKGKGKGKAKSSTPGEVKPGDKEDKVNIQSSPTAKATTEKKTDAKNSPPVPPGDTDGADEADEAKKKGMKAGVKPGAKAGAKPPFTKRLSDALKSALGASFDSDEFVKSLDSNLIPPDAGDNVEFGYSILTKSSTPSLRYTLGPVYMPNSLDAHDEWTTPEELQKAAWDYVEKTGADRTVYLQHSPLPAGKWVEMVTWPSEVTTTLMKSVDGVKKSVSTTLPPGTVYMGVVWEDWAHEMVEKGEITGFSMGGWAQRIESVSAA